MIVRRPSSHLTTSSTSSASSAGSSFTPPSVLTDGWGTDEEEAMSTDEYLPATRPLSVAIPGMGAHGPYCPRRPNLQEILSSTSPPPWTLTAFMAYLSNNHCLETLEFTMDAGRYRKHYAKMMSRASGNGLPPTKDCEYVKALWQRLVDAYIRPSGSREVNLPSAVRDPIINLKMAALPPSPEVLDPAVAKIYELMEDSVLVPFLNSVYPQSAHPSMQTCAFGTSDDNIAASRGFEDTTLYNRRNNLHLSSPPQVPVNPHGHSHPAAQQQFRQSAPVSFGGANHRSRFNTKLSQTTSSPTTSAATSEMGLDAPLTYSGSASSGTGMTDDSGSTGSPTNDLPSTPPFGGPTNNEVSGQKRDSGMWKKLGRLSGMKPGKKKSHGGLKAGDE